MELRHLRYFVAVAEALNFSKAAEGLLVAQPAVSRQIADLEHDVGTVLLLRNKRTVRLTAAGEAFLYEAKGILAQVDAAVEKARRVARGEVGELTIAFLGAPTMCFLPGLIKQYRHLYPQVTVRLIEMTPERQLDAFARGHLQVGFTRPLPPGADRSLMSSPVLKEALQAVVPDRHPLAARKQLRLEDLSELPFVLLDRSEAVGLFDQIIAVCRGAGFSPRIVNSPNLMATVLTLVAAEQGVSLVPESVRNLGSREVVFLDLEPGPAPIELVMVWGRELPLLTAFQQLVRANLESIRRTFAPRSPAQGREDVTCTL